MPIIIDSDGLGDDPKKGEDDDEEEDELSPEAQQLTDKTIKTIRRESRIRYPKNELSISPVSHPSPVVTPLQDSQSSTPDVGKDPLPRSVKDKIITRIQSDHSPVKQYSPQHKPIDHTSSINQILPQFSSYIPTRLKSSLTRDQKIRYNDLLHRASTLRKDNHIEESLNTYLEAWNMSDEDQRLKRVIDDLSRKLPQTDKLLQTEFSTV